MRKPIVTLVASLVLALFSNGAFAQQTAPAAWGGWARCQITVQGPGYTHQQTHTWTITGGAPTAQGAFQIYAGTWASVGSGSLSRTQGTQTLMAQWAINAPDISAPIAVFVRASDRRMFIQSRHAQLRSAAAIQGYQQLTVAGKPQTPGKIAAEAFEWAFPVIAVSAPVAPDTNATANGSSTAPTTGSVGPMQPAGSQGTASCTWQFGQGSAAPAPPPTLAAQAIPTPGNPATTTPPANNPPGTTPTASTTPPSVQRVDFDVGASVNGTASVRPVGAPTSPCSARMGTSTCHITVDAGTPVELRAVADANYDFDKWSGTGCSPVSNNPLFFSAQQSMSCTASFRQEVIGTPSPAGETARLVSIAPASIEQGVSNSDVITLSGEGTHWQQGATTVNFGPGITIQGGVRVLSPTSLTTQLTVAYTAASGPRAITVTTGSETVTLTNALAITAREQPVITQISPDNAAVGAQNVTVTFTGRGTRWEQGKTALLLHNAPGLTQASAISVNSPTSMTVSFSIAPSAAPGPREITVLNSGVVVGSDIITVADGFTVNLPAPALPLTATPLDPSLLPMPVICTLRGPGRAQTNNVTPKTARLFWTPVAGATGYSVSRRDLGVLTPAPLNPAIGYFYDRRMAPHPMSYVYTITAHYPQGCGSTDFTLNTQPPSTPPVSYEAGSGVGSVKLRWGHVYSNDVGQSRDSDGVLITGPALPTTGREVRHSTPSSASGSTIIIGVPAGSRTWTLKAYWDTTYGRVMDNTGRTITVTVP